MTRSAEAFHPGQGYSKEDWDAVDFHEMADKELTSMCPAKEILPPEFFKAMEENRNSHDRPSLEHSKKQIALRLEEEVIEKFRKNGDG